jgi:GNAT superfamily N-acetyltransferase
LFDLEAGVPGVRLATKADEGEIFGLLVLLHAENAMFSMNREKVLAGIRLATERQGGIIFVIDEGPRVVATLGMCIASDWYSDDEYLLERWNYVHPDFRRSDYGRKLLEQGKWAHEWFKTRGKIMPFFCGIISFLRTEAKIRMYARHVPCVGGFFMYGETPRQGDLARREMTAIEDLNKLNSGRSRGEERVRPQVETLIRVSRSNKSGEEHVR